MITDLHRKVLVAGMLGWLLDAMDAMLFSFALTGIRAEFQLTNAQTGALASVTLLTSVGGVLFGLLADRIGRVRALSFSILAYSVFTAMLATASSVWELFLWRALVGFGLGGEWAVGAALVAETWPAQHRGKAIGIMQSGWALGYLLAAALAAVVLPQWGWRALFLLGILPALFTFWIRRNLSHLETRPAQPRPAGNFTQMFSREWLRYTLTATGLAACVLFAYWGLFTWVPAFLSSPLEKGGAGLSVFQSSTWIIPMQIGSFLGYIGFGFLSDRFGRRPVFAAFVLGAATTVVLYGQAAHSTTTLLLLGPLLGFFGHGYFSVFGALLAELFPGGFRATAQAFCYNAGRAFSALAPFTVGWFADRTGIGGALGLSAFFFVAAAAIIYLLPETKGRELTTT